MLRWMTATAVALAALLAIAGTTGDAPAAPAAAPEEPALPEPIAIDLKPVKWQTLPPRVIDAWVGPGDRVWLEIEAPKPPAIDIVQKVIEREWDKPMPQLVGAKVALFEGAPLGVTSTRPAPNAASTAPGGPRVWFIARGNQTLLAYDGKTWLRKDVTDKLTGDAPNHGHPPEGATNYFIDGVALFPDATSVLCYDGRAWSQKTFARTARNRIALAPEPDGKGAIAYSRETIGVMFRFREGAWSALGQTGTMDNPMPISGLAVGPQGVWWITNGELAFAPLAMGASTQPASEFTALVEQLGADEFVIREQASAKLLALGAGVVPRIETALKTAADPEIRARLERIRDRLLGVDRSGPVAFGGTNFAAVSHLYPLPDGSVVALGTRTRGAGDAEDHETAVLMDPAGKVRTLVVRPTGNDSAFTADDWSVLSPRPGLVWLSINATGRNAAPTLYDQPLSKTALPEAKFRSFITAKSDGTLFVTDRNPPRNAKQATAGSTQRIGVFDPNVK